MYTEGHFQCFSRERYPSTFRHSASALNSGTNPLELLQVVLCAGKQRNDMDENIKDKLFINRWIVHVDVSVFT